MPLDSSTFETKVDPRALRGREALAYLATELRKPMPAGFAWNFGNWFKLRQNPACGFSGCAIGLAIWRGIADISDVEMKELNNRWDDPAGVQMRNWACGQIAGRFGLDRPTFRVLFESPVVRSQCQRLNDPILPDEVADAIDFYLANGRLRYEGEPENISQASV